MKHEEFEIGKKFMAAAGFVWLCTDKGSRTITAIMLDPEKDPSWFVGPPYAVEEVVFDENDMPSCYNNQKDMLEDRLDDFKKSSHPGFQGKDFFRMMKRGMKFDKKAMKAGFRSYPHEKLSRRDRVGEDGRVWHPYATERTDDGWLIHIFELFSREFSTIPDGEFVRLPLATEADMAKRKAAVPERKRKQKRAT